MNTDGDCGTLLRYQLLCLDSVFWAFVKEANAVNDVLENTMLTQSAPNEIVWYSIKGFFENEEHDVERFLLLSVLFDQETSGVNRVGRVSILHKSSLAHCRFGGLANLAMEEQLEYLYFWNWMVVGGIC